VIFVGRKQKRKEKTVFHLRPYSKKDFTKSALYELSAKSFHYNLPGFSF
jgi:hypothetical protein